MGRTTGVLLVAVLGIGLVAGCGSGNNTSAPVTATVSVPLLQRPNPKPKLFAPIYLNIEGPARAELARFAAEARHWDGRVTDARRASAAVPAMFALRKANRELLRVRWPRGAAGAVEALISANRALDDDLDVIDVTRSARLLPGGGWTKQFAHDAGKAAAADTIIRADLLRADKRAEKRAHLLRLLASPHPSPV
jgi:hypothetical protein